MIIKDKDGYDWYVHDINTKDENSEPILDAGTGPKRVIRTFVIQTDPSQDLLKEDVLDHHRKGLESHINKCGLTLDRELRISAGNQKGEFVVFAILKPALQKFGMTHLMEQKTKLAQDILRKKKS